MPVSIKKKKQTQANMDSLRLLFFSILFGRNPFLADINLGRVTVFLPAEYYMSNPI